MAAELLAAHRVDLEGSDRDRGRAVRRPSEEHRKAGRRVSERDADSGSRCGQPELTSGW